MFCSVFGPSCVVIACFPCHSKPEWKTMEGPPRLQTMGPSNITTSCVRRYSVVWQGQLNSHVCCLCKPNQLFKACKVYLQTVIITWVKMAITCNCRPFVIEWVSSPLVVAIYQFTQTVIYFDYWTVHPYLKCIP